MNKVRISNTQLGLLAFAFLYGSTAILNGSLDAKRDAWIASILALSVGFVLITMYLFISKLNKGKNFVGILENCFGKVFGKIIGILYILHFCHIASFNVRGFGEFMLTVSYDAAPPYILMGVIIMVTVYATRSGMGTIGRMTEIFVPIIPISIGLSAFSIMVSPDFSVFEPILVEIAPVIKAAATVVSTVFGDWVVFLMILPYTNDEKGRFKSVYIAVAVIGVGLLLITVRDTLLIGPGLFENVSYPFHVAAQMLPAINIDPIVDINLLLGGGFKIIVHVYAATKMTAEIFNIDDYKPLVWAFGVFVFVCAYWVFPNIIEMKNYIRGISNIIYRFPFQTIIPILMLIISTVKYNEKKGAKSEGQ